MNSQLLEVVALGACKSGPMMNYELRSESCKSKIVMEKGFGWSCRNK